MDATDIERVTRSVCQEYGLRCSTVRVTRGHDDPHFWRVEIRRADVPEVVLVSLFCGPATSFVNVRDSLKRQLELD